MFQSATGIFDRGKLTESQTVMKGKRAHQFLENTSGNLVLTQVQLIQWRPF